MSAIARDFLTRCFAPEETIALLLRRSNGERPTQRVVRLEQALAPAYLRWLAHENHAGANVYVAANPLRSGSRRRTKDCIASVRHLYIDIDTDGDTRLAALRASNAVPSPTAILATSPRKYQVLWRVERFDFELQETTLKLLAIAFGGDPACTDCNRVLRVPGFLNRKYHPAYRITVEYPCDSIAAPNDFQLTNAAELAVSRSSVFCARKPAQKHSDSEDDWAWVLRELEHGKDAVELTGELALRRSDKPNPLYYAQRTVDVASARLWLAQGRAVNEVGAMLTARRGSELPATLCSARAREIASTAQRLISRKKTA